jgi:hypothetical protein
MLLVILTATGQTERLFQTQTALIQQIDTQRQISDLRRFHKAQIPYYEVLGAIHTHSNYGFPVIVASEAHIFPPGFVPQYVDRFIAEMHVHDGGGCDCSVFTSTPANNVAINDDIRGLSANLRFDARVLQDGSGVPIALLFTY